MIDLERGDFIGAFVGRRVKRGCNPGGERRPPRVVLVRQEAEATVPIAPEHLDGMVPLPRALCPRVVVVLMPTALANRVTASARNSGAASERKTSGVPKVNTMRSRKGCSHVDASRLCRGVGITTTYREVGSIRANASVYPVSVDRKGGQQSMGRILSCLVDLARRTVLRPPSTCVHLPSKSANNRNA
jgi:hypothetical protein